MNLLKSNKFILMLNKLAWKKAHFADNLIFKNNERIHTHKRKINIMSPVWGEPINTYFNYAIPCLLQEGNIPSLIKEGYEIELCIYTRLKDYAVIKNLINNDITKYMKVLIVTFDMEAKDRNDLLIKATLYQIKKCIDEDAWSIMCFADNVSGNGTMYNMVKLVENKNICAAISYARFSKESLSKSKEFDEVRAGTRTIDNDEMIDLFFKYGHKSILDSFDNMEENSTHSGISIRKIDKDNYAVIHNIPSVTIAHFDKSDLKFFQRYRIFNQWDRLWMRKLIKENRVKIIGTSDIAFYGDISADNEKNIPLKPNLYNDKIAAPKDRLLNNFVCNSFCCVWRRKNKRWDEGIKNLRQNYGCHGG